jgi:hypothetical protein
MRCAGEVGPDCLYRRPRSPSSKTSMIVVRAPWPPTCPEKPQRSCRRDCPDISVVAVRNAIGFRDAWGTLCHIRCPPGRVRWLQEPVAGSAAGGMQPAPMDAGEPGGQAAAELAADRGHRRPGERASLLQAKVVNLEPGDLAVLPAADDRLGDLDGVDAKLGPGVLGQARSSLVRSATNTSSPASRSGWPVSSAYTRLPSGWGTRGSSNAAGATIRMVPASGSPADPGGSSSPR